MSNWTEEEQALVEQIISCSDDSENAERELLEMVARCEADGNARLPILQCAAAITEPIRAARRTCDEVMDIAEGIDWDRDSIESLHDKLEQMQAVLDRLERHGDEHIRFAGSAFLPMMKKQIAWTSELVEQIEQTGNRGGHNDEGITR